MTVVAYQPSAYLSGADDFAMFGVAASTSAAQVTQASLLLDLYLQRPEGLCYLQNAVDGMPVGMVAKKPAKILKVQGAIQAGKMVTFNVTGGQISPDLMGQSIMLFDNTGQLNTVEACIVQGVTGTNQVTLASVAYAHPDQTYFVLGKSIIEQRTLPKDRPITRISRSPHVQTMSCSGRYNFGRRSDQMSGTLPEVNLLTELQTFGGAPAWVAIDPQTMSVSDATGEVWIPAGIYIAYFSEVRMQYLAGFPIDEVPFEAKLATAALINAKVATADLGGTISSIKAGDTMITRASGVITLLDNDTRTMLGNLRAQSFY